MHRSILWGSVLAVSLGLAGATFAAKPTKPSAVPVCPTDDAARLKSVLAFLHEENQSAIELGRLAISRAQSSEVKSFADRLVREHTDADGRLADVAARKKIALDPIVSADPITAALRGADAKAKAALAKKSGAAFDASYLGPQVMEHELALSAIDEAQKVTQDEEIKRLLSDLRVTLDAHRGHAEDLLGTMSIESGPAAGVGGGPPQK